MTATAHALVGGAIAYAVPDPLIGVTLAFISHPFLDMIPHWDEGRGWREKSKMHLFLEGALDLSLGLALSYVIFGRNMDPIYYLVAVFAAWFLDLAQIPYWFFHWKFPPFSWIYSLQHHLQGRATPLFGIFTQVATVFAVFLALQVFHY